jgi:hypothetical protein
MEYEFMHAKPCMNERNYERAFNLLHALVDQISNACKPAGRQLGPLGLGPRAQRLNWHMPHGCWLMHHYQCRCCLAKAAAAAAAEEAHHQNSFRLDLS